LEAHTGVLQGFMGRYFFRTPKPLSFEKKPQQKELLMYSIERERKRGVCRSFIVCSEKSDWNPSI
jgi:hypothetical protein